jgi:repressor LexA
MYGLTARQQLVLDFVRASIAEHGYAPTIREIGAHIGIRSTNGVNDHLRALERKGHIVRVDMKSRAMRLVVRDDDACPHCGALPVVGKAS